VPCKELIRVRPCDIHLFIKILLGQKIVEKSIFLWYTEEEVIISGKETKDTL